MQQEDDRVLGREARGAIGEDLDTVPWTHGDSDAVVEFTTNELTALCPVTGQPDFYELKFSYRLGSASSNRRP
jgi:7-cyano-7-deazaguanine reductase